jgi:GNAT superfamily N-acetyltransferase
MSQSSPAPLRIETLTGPALVPVLPALARLRTEVFRAWPYLYEGEADYEQTYIQAYVTSPRAAIIVAFDGAEPVGASTCLPLADETDNIQAPFRARGIDPARVFYFGESVLLPRYRGSGAGVAFFAAREAHARAVSEADYAAFCAVIRAPDDPRRPPDAVPLDAFWRKRGYTPMPGMTCTMHWREIGTTGETENRLAFWLKSLTGAPLP